MRQIAVATARPTAALYAKLSIFPDINSYMRPEPNRRAPATAKSARLQSTSSVNCIANKGTNNIINVTSAIHLMFLFFIMIIVPLLDLEFHSFHISPEPVFDNQASEVLNLISDLYYLFVC